MRRRAQTILIVAFCILMTPFDDVIKGPIILVGKAQCLLIDSNHIDVISSFRRVVPEQFIIVYLRVQVTCILGRLFGLWMRRKYLPTIPQFCCRKVFRKLWLHTIKIASKPYACTSKRQKPSLIKFHFILLITKNIFGNLIIIFHLPIN